MYNLPITILKNNDGTYAIISNLFNIVTEGNSMEEAIANGKEALFCHIEGLEKTDEEYIILQYLKNSVNTSVII